MESAELMKDYSGELLMKANQALQLLGYPLERESAALARCEELGIPVVHVLAEGEPRVYIEELKEWVRSRVNSNHPRFRYTPEAEEPAPEKPHPDAVWPAQ